MQSHRLALRTLPLAVVCASFACASLHASQDHALTGQWVGSSQVDGAATSARTVLTLGAADTDDSTLRIEGKRTCTLKQGSFTSNAADALTLTFKMSNGGGSCERLAGATFKVRAGDAPRTLAFEASYPAASGGQIVRRGALARYP